MVLSMFYVLSLQSSGTRYNKFWDEVKQYTKSGNMYVTEQGNLSK
jgi:hypothetical protein